VKTARLIQTIIRKIKRFAEESILHTVFTNLKKELKKDCTFTSIFRSFLEKLNKGKEYVLIDDSIQVNNPDQIFKVFEGGAFDKDIHILADTSDILELLLRKKSLKLE